MIRTMLGAALAVTAFIAATVVSRSAGAGCGSDADCKGNRICEKGICVAPGTVPAAVTSPLPPSSGPEDGVVPTQPAAAGAAPVPANVQLQPEAQRSAGEPESDFARPKRSSYLTGPAPDAGDRLHLLETANGGRITGLTFDFLGYIAFVSGGIIAANSDYFALGCNVMSWGSGLLTIASVIGTISYTVRHGALVDAGYDVSAGPKAGAWLLTAFTLLSMGGSVAMGAIALEEEDSTLALVSLGLSFMAALLEVINWEWVRSGSWDRAMQNAPRTSSRSSQVLVLPTIAMIPNSSGRGGLTPLFGIAARF